MANNHYYLRSLQINKATSTHIGLLKGQLARLRTQLLLPSSSSGGQEGIFSYVDAQDVVIKFDYGIIIQEVLLLQGMVMEEWHW